ncbi:MULTISPECIES: glyceraldehyde-3-phosphate dehydrogenase [Halomonadaceae]|uniref:Glyceraldehyde-3-phosphate dehydrogenase n=1 Tax=Vreelandella titanicae TaxID=664683 RepID=A0A653TFV9_9GAMM|nr:MULTISPECIES: glyceraldehyde-3-phosphate dehydrogenase [Halomonas]QKS23834.1 Glyceraldehyde-3-phosphate dehydrogenase-like protein [Halomonas titanicae]TMU17901.1 glyceraldehyde-3-phosphate dehydrogenase [Halomonas sp. ATBC28]CAD5253440.1 Glyceraldehyde-3-phosphate dehydrogenase-like protein [Halomonas sp. I3]CAD5255443.1 Glyceraldehyde-3-phosphate dehydrogenase-like protein [Halomonas sp. 156]CAD5293619.1 Glyceraldehyde-3-phosphate dehydrogenase-like protein [Halomonas sp. 113]
MSQQALENVFQEWQGNEALAEQMIPLVGQLYRQNNVVATMFGRSLIKRSVIRILKDHRFVRKIEGTELSVEDTYSIVKGMVALNLGPAHVDVGKLAVMFKNRGGGDVEAFLRKELQEVIDGYQPGASTGEPQDVVLYGFGRIGRLLARVMIEKAGGGNLLRLRAIVVRGRGDVAKDLEKRASLLRRDSVHGPFDGTIMVDAEARTLTVNGNVIQVIYADSPSEIDYTEYDIDNAVIVDNTGIWRDEEGLGQHLQCKGAAKALLTAPGKGDIKNIVYGINHESIGDSDLIVSAASCTTNAIVPVLKVLNDEYGVVNGHVETVHAYTNDQNLIDNYHKGDRRGRSAALNMVLTETGAAKAVSKALPELEGKLTGNAIRVPIPNVSMAILNLTLDKATDAVALNDYLRRMSIESAYQKQIDFVDSAEVVSSDFVGNRHAGIVDAKATIANGHHAVIYVWYDNEFGYSCQVVRILQQMSNVRFLKLPR